MGDVKRRGRTVQVTLTAEEVGVLVALAHQVSDLLSPDNGRSDADGGPDVDPLEELVGMSRESVAAPDDPALKRLLPDAYGDDDTAAGEFRRLMDGELRRLKTEALDELLEGLSGSEGAPATLRLPPQQVEAWLQALTDIRLVLGTRLDVTEDMTETWQSLAPDDPRAPLLAAYDWLGWLQESLVQALDD